VRSSLFAPVRRAHAVRAAAAVALFIGYADLARGGITFAPALIVIGYLVLLPASILWR
jgi:hypothetical protein